MNGDKGTRTDIPPCNNECYIVNKKNQRETCGCKSGNGYFCSRNMRHEGSHVACGEVHALHIWNDEYD